MRSSLIVCVLAGALIIVGPAAAGPLRADAPLSIRRTQPIRTPGALERARSEARQVTARFLGALDQGQYARACSLLARQFYRVHHIPDRQHCVAGFSVGFGGWAVKFKILGVDAQIDKAVVHCVVDGSPGTVQLIREAAGFRISGMHAD